MALQHSTLTALLRPRTTFMRRRRRCEAMWKYLIIVLRAAMACTVPYHSWVVSDCTWQCNAGYFKTVSTPNPTCRQCATCPAGSIVRPCAAESDTGCDPCPTLMGAAAYDTNCNITACSPGWWWAAPRCMPCPLGAYCTNSLKMACGANCTTHDRGASSALQCEGTPSSLLTVTLPVYAPPPEAPPCPSFGAPRLACTLTPVTAQTTYMVCKAASCMPYDLEAWVLHQALDTALQACLGVPVGVPVVQHGVLVPYDHPLPSMPALRYDSIPWKKTLYVLGAVTILGLSLLISIALLCAAWCIKPLQLRRVKIQHTHAFRAA